MKQIERKWIFIALGLMLVSVIGLLAVGLLVDNEQWFWGLIILCGIVQAGGYGLWMYKLRCPSCKQATLRMKKYSDHQATCPKCHKEASII
jgi:hypothetical protein